MKRLILMRHGKADWHAEGGDHARRLTPRGRAGAEAMGDWLRERGWIPGEILCSTAARTRETLALLEMPEDRACFERRLYLAEADEILAALHGVEAETVLVVGHNHGLADLAHSLVREAPPHPRFDDYPTCATTLLSFKIADWSDIRRRSGICEGFATPGDVTPRDVVPE
ncbi:histidine phosphatase family protein [Marivita sp. GX14005]|uniref:SixA phosphatase family protein n=1 Tax=Marivita sp. GX14005 TaxID=2942276 RepID=UPI002018C39C|nr:histidine phosphatase family protein [Marivita sp. GX14005]MCL3881100.1 histidine phosphatase family protein [Marivita sp. GX14005]